MNVSEELGILYDKQLYLTLKLNMSRLFINCHEKLFFFDQFSQNLLVTQSFTYKINFNSLELQ